MRSQGKRKSVRFRGVSTIKMLYKNKNTKASELGRETMYVRTKPPPVSYYLGSPTRTKPLTRKRAAPHPPEKPYVNKYWYWNGRNVRRNRRRGTLSLEDAIREGERLNKERARLNRESERLNRESERLIKEYEALQAKYRK